MNPRKNLTNEIYTYYLEKGNSGEFPRSDTGDYEDVLCDVKPCSMEEMDRRFKGAISIIRAVSLIEGASTSETSVHFCQTTRCKNPKDS
jgi:hypothetical protein